MLYLRLWTTPDLQLEASLDLFGLGVATVETVRWTRRGGVAQVHSLVQTVVEGDDVKADVSVHWIRLSVLLNYISVCRLQPLEVIASRVEPITEQGQPCCCIAYPGPPPPVAQFHYPLGFPHSLRPIAPDGQMPKRELQNAMHWFAKGLAAVDALDRTMYLWIALEALVPEIKQPPTCGRCNAKTLKCPDCGDAEPEFRVTKAIQEYLARTLSLDKKEIRRLYAIRSQIVHGGLFHGQAAHREANYLAMRLLQITLGAIKHELGWPQDDLPTISDDGFTANLIELTPDLAAWSLVDRKTPIVAKLKPIRGSGLA